MLSPIKGSGREWSATNPPTTVDGTSTECQPEVANPAVEMLSPLAFTSHADCSFQSRSCEPRGAGGSVAKETAVKNPTIATNVEKLRLAAIIPPGERIVRRSIKSV